MAFPPDALLAGIQPKKGNGNAEILNPASKAAGGG